MYLNRERKKHGRTVNKGEKKTTAYMQYFSGTHESRRYNGKVDREKQK